MRGMILRPYLVDAWAEVENVRQFLRESPDLDSRELKEKVRQACRALWKVALVWEQVQQENRNLYGHPRHSYRA
jgi:chromosome condensin MukBEF MukE localization factor